MDLSFFLQNTYKYLIDLVSCWKESLGNARLTQRCFLLSLPTACLLNHQFNPTIPHLIILCPISFAFLDSLHLHSIDTSALDPVGLMFLLNVCFFFITTYLSNLDFFFHPTNFSPGQSFLPSHFKAPKKETRALVLNYISLPLPTILYSFSEDLHVFSNIALSVYHYIFLNISFLLQLFCFFTPFYLYFLH